MGEAKVGVGKNAKNLVMITLGTGIGGGIVADGKLYEGKGSAAEIGHICIDPNGKECGCGLRGCWEKYASATALLEYAEDAAKSNPESLLSKLFDEKGKSGEAFFEAVKNGCSAANGALDKYTTYLAAGINGLKFVFDPDMIILSGGITNAGSLLLDPLKKKIKGDLPVEISVLKNDAGITGAALLG